MTELDDAIKELNKRFGPNTIMTGNDILALAVARIPTGSLSLDIETGGGFPCGRVIELFGRESTGKTFMALKTVAEAQKLKKECVWIDVEGTFDPTWAATLGVDPKALRLSKPETGERACDILDAIIRSGACGVAVVDSTAALLPQKELETAMEDCEQIGTRAKMINRLTRKLHSALNMKVGEDLLPNDCLVIFINQIREKIGVMYGSPDTTPGGLGLRHAASIRVEFRSKWIKDKENEEHIVGQTVTFVTKKNKTFAPYRHGEFNFFVDGAQKGHIDLAEEVLRYGMLSGLIGHEGKSYMLGNEKIVGYENAAQLLRSTPKLVQDLKPKILAHYFNRKA
jgi:recombination protein RecA